jgi:hypothetical protein
VVEFPISDEEQTMADLARILSHAEIDTASLRLLFQLHGDTVHGLTADGYDAFDTWEKLRDLVPQTGHWPVVLERVGDEELPTQRIAVNPATLAEKIIEYPDTQSILREAEKVNVLEWIANKQQQHVQCIKEDLEASLQAGDEQEADHFRALLAQPPELRGVERADWPAHAEPSSRWGIGAGVTHDQDMNSYNVTIALLPTPHSWHAPAILKFGGWNACPWPHEHVAFLRHWEERFGAQVVCLTRDTIECLVSRSPQTRSDALLLARDQYCYCSDIIFQGVGSLDALAAQLLNGESWYFWWD